MRISDWSSDVCSSDLEIWNRGHLAMSDHAQRISPEAGCNTHVFWNASPQAADLNQGPWLHLENYSAAASNKYRSVWVIAGPIRSEEHTSELQSLMRISYAVFCLKKKK